MARMNYERAASRARVNRESFGGYSDFGPKYGPPFDGKPRDWSPLQYGKHKGRTIPEVMLTDPGWFYWMLEEKRFGDLLYQALKAAQMMQHVMPPRPDPDNWRFAIEFRKGRFYDFTIIPKDHIEKYRKRGRTICKHLDFSIVSETGWDMNEPRRRMVSRFKREFFEMDEDCIKAKDIQAFFSNESNFDLLCRKVHCQHVQRWGDNVILGISMPE